MGDSDHKTTYMRSGGDDGAFRPWRYIYVHSIERGIMQRVKYQSI